MSRFDYVRYDARPEGLQATAKVRAGQLEELIAPLPDGRAKALALTKLEECYMWIGKAIRDAQIKRNGSAEPMEQRKDG